MSADSVTDRTPYPLTTDIAKEVILSHSRLPEGEYEEDNKANQLDHSKLHDYVKNPTKFDLVPETEDTKTLADQGIYETPELEKVVTEYGRDLSATVSCLVEVTKDLMAKVTALENA